jgi:ABC-type nitrate/sulfonate/bicarbonate transport system ATPase subunit
VPFKYLAQDFDLMPYTTVAENVVSLSNGFKALKNYVEQLLEMVEMTEFANVQAKVS